MNCSITLLTVKGKGKICNYFQVTTEWESTHRTGPIREMVGELVNARKEEEVNLSTYIRTDQTD